MKKSILRLIYAIEARYPDMHFVVENSWPRHYTFYTVEYYNVEEMDGGITKEYATNEMVFNSEKELKDFLPTAVDNEKWDEGAWRVLWENEHCIDCTHGYATFERAKDEALWILVEWERSFVEEHKVDFNDKENWPHKVKLDWDMMVTDCNVSVVQKNFNGQLDEYWSPSYEDWVDIGWLPFDEEE